MDGRSRRSYPTDDRRPVIGFRGEVSSNYTGMGPKLTANFEGGPNLVRNTEFSKSLFLFENLVLAPSIALDHMPRTK